MTGSSTSARMKVLLPTEVTKDLSGDVPLRKHAHFVAEALEHELHRLQVEAALDVSAGAWSDNDHPDLADGPAIDRWIAEGRVQKESRCQLLPRSC